MTVRNIKTDNTKSRVDWAYDVLKERILNNQYPPGFHALEQELAEELGVSRTPLRESLIRLQNEGLIELIPRRGMRVVPISAADMREIYEVLTCLESTAAELLAERRPAEDDLLPMSEAVEDMEKALDKGDLEAWAEADERFHRLLLELCGNQRILSITSTMRDQGHRARMTSLRLRPLPTRSNEEHRQLLDAIRNGDPVRAREVHHQHRKHASQMLTSIFEKYNLVRL